MSGLDEVKIGVRYVHKGKLLSGMPSALEILSEVQVEYETLPGWQESLAECRKFSDLPPAAQAYVLRVEELLGVPVRWIGVGAGRLDIIDRGATHKLDRKLTRVVATK